MSLLVFWMGVKLAIIYLVPAIFDKAGGGCNSVGVWKVASKFTEGVNEQNYIVSSL